MKMFAMFAAAVLFAASPALAAEKTLNGTISDAKCAGKNKPAEHGSQADSDHECSNKCVEGGGKYVFASGDKVYALENQKDPALARYAGQAVTVTGELQGDTIKATKITQAK